MSREVVQQRLWKLTHHATADHDRYGQQFGARFSGETYPAFAEPNDILVMVAGAAAVFHGHAELGGADHGNCPVSVKVEHELYRKPDPTHS